MAGSPKTDNIKRAAQKVVERIGKGQKVVMGEVMRETGYGPEYSQQPGRITNHPAFLEVLEAAGITDLRLASAHQDLLAAAKIERITFDAKSISKRVKDKKGRVKRVMRYESMSDEAIRKVVEAMPGHKVLGINRFRSVLGQVEVIYSVPDNQVRRAALELAHRLKGTLKPEKMLVVPSEGRIYELPEARKNKLDEIIQDNHE